MLKCLLPILLLTYFDASAELFEDCYSSQEEVVNLVAGEKVMVSNWLNVKQSNGYYEAEGEIVGANYHLCSIVLPVEGSNDVPLNLSQIDSVLYYRRVDSDYGIDCQLERHFMNETVVIKDANNDCSRYVFSCGVRIRLDGTTLKKSN